MTKQKIKELVPLALMVGALVYTTFSALTTDVLLTRPHWLAYGLSSLVTLTYFLKKKISNVLLGLTIILGLLNVLAFTPTVTTIGAGIGFTAFDADVTIEFQLFSMLLLVAFIYANGKAFLAWINRDGL